MKKEIITTLSLATLAIGVIALPPLTMEAAASGGGEKQEYRMMRDDDDRDGYTNLKRAAPMPADQVIAGLKKKGFKQIHEIELMRRAYEVKAINADGKKVKFYVNRTTGEILN